LDEKFIDTVPPSFTWQQGQIDVPVIFSSDFMEMYKYLRQARICRKLSDKTMSSVNIILNAIRPSGVQNFMAHIVALSDRINSVLVPQSFMTWANKNLAAVTKVNASRIYLKTKDANDPQLLSYLEKKEYRVNKDKTKFGRVKQVLQSDRKRT
jgi:hypothetical protein